MFGQAQLKIPIIGLVENMSYFTPAELPANKYYLFGKQGGRKLADEYDLPFLGEIPLVQSIREGGDQGVPVMMSDDKVSKQAFEQFASLVVRSIAMGNAHIKTEQIASLV
jgi:ATP-binding protein involved in chromosome partitioning